MYESKISNARWIAYDIPGNLGWIVFLLGLVRCLAGRPEIMENGVIFALLLLDVLCGAAMIVGIVELICERIRGLDRILPRKRLYRGFGALTFGGLAGLLASLPVLIVALLNRLDGAGDLILLCAGGLLCALFGGLLLKEYKKIPPASERNTRL